MTVHRTALLDANNVVSTVVVLDPTNDWDTPDGLTAVTVPNDSPVGAGWIYDNGDWTPPPAPEVDDTPSVEDQLATMQQALTDQQAMIDALIDTLLAES